MEIEKERKRQRERERERRGEEEKRNRIVNKDELYIVAEFRDARRCRNDFFQSYITILSCGSFFYFLYCSDIFFLGLIRY